MTTSINNSNRLMRAKTMAKKIKLTHLYDLSLDDVISKRVLCSLSSILNILDDNTSSTIHVKSGTTGHMFKCTTPDNYSIAVKIVPYFRNKDLGGISTKTRPENVELLITRYITSYVINEKLPHVVIPITCFLIKTSDIIKYLNPNTDIIKRIKNNELHTYSSVLLTEWCTRGDFNTFINNPRHKISPDHWRVFLFHIFITLAIIHKEYPTFRHNDLKANNILVFKGDSEQDYSRQYIFNDVEFKVPYIGCVLQLWDYDFASIENIITNTKVELPWTTKLNITSKRNQYYDIHYFISSLTAKGFYKHMNDEYLIGSELISFIDRVIPPQYKWGKARTTSENTLVGSGGRLLVDDEYTTPAKIIMNDPYFSRFRVLKK